MLDLVKNSENKIIRLEVLHLRIGGNSRNEFRMFLVGQLQQPPEFRIRWIILCKCRKGQTEPCFPQFLHRVHYFSSAIAAEFVSYLLC
jgi:hypothetical protein